MRGFRHVTSARTAGTRFVQVILGWLLLAAVLRGAVLLPERCGDVDQAGIRGAATAATAWFARNQHDDGRWLYRYDAADDRDLGGYNAVRHAGVTWSLYQAAAAGIGGALDVADRGTAYALAHLLHDGDRAAFWPDAGPVRIGATALLLAGLVERRAFTGDTRHDALLRAFGRFLGAQVEGSGAVLASWDPTTGRAVPGERSPFFTGETYWALTRLHATFPGDGWDGVARRVGHYLATARDDAEGYFPDVADHWAAYGLSETVAWPEHAREARPLTAAEVAYARRQAGLAAMTVRWESQRTDRWPNWWLRGHRADGALMATTGEHLTGLWRAAARDERLAGVRAPLRERTRCAAAMLVARQTRQGEGPMRAQGAWFVDGVTQMDHQQHALSALLRSAPIVGASGGSSGDDAADRSRPAPGAWLVAAAVLAAVNPVRAGRTLRQRRPPAPVVALGGLVAVAVALVLTATSGPLLDALDVSRPTVRIGAGIVLAAAAVHDLFARVQPLEPAGRGWAAAIVPVAVPLLLRAHVVVLLASAGADVGVVATTAALAAAAVATLVLTRVNGDTLGDWASRLVAAVLAVVGVALAVDGVFDV